jgi:hypothetical protein
LELEASAAAQPRSDPTIESTLRIRILGKEKEACMLKEAQARMNDTTILIPTPSTLRRFDGAPKGWIAQCQKDPQFFKAIAMGKRYLNMN